MDRVTYLKNVFYIMSAASGEESITAEELRGLSDAVSSLRPKKVLNEELEELKEDREEYRHVSSLELFEEHVSDSLDLDMIM